MIYSAWKDTANGGMTMGRNLEDFVKRNYQKAIDRHEIQAYYQPVIRTSSGKLCSFEALSRWIDPELGMIYPDEFIPVLEKEKTIYLLDLAILNQVCVRLRSSIARGETPIPVSVNLSRLDFTLCDIFSMADSIVSDYQLPHDFIYFEITESVAAEQKEMLMGIVERFRAAGYQIWMDDFGSAYSSLNALKEFSFDELKLDMCFLRPFSLRSKRIATAVVEMAKAIDIHTLAEGVETEEQYHYLRNIGCEKVQGYYFGGPMTYDAALAHLRKKGIEIELPQDRQYYDDIGRIDILSAVPFMTREEQDAIVTARQLNSIPLALGEFRAESFSVLFYNSAFEEIAAATGLFPLVFTQEMLCKPQPNSLLSERIINLMDSVSEGGMGRMLFTVRQEYYELMVRRVAKARDRYCVLIRVTNLTKDTQADNIAYLDGFSRRLYALFERITLINFRENTIRPLYTSIREDLVSGREDVARMVVEYAEKYIYPEDRERFIRQFNPQAAFARLAESGDGSFSEVFRSNVRQGQYAWKEYTLLKIDEDNYFMLLRNVHGNATSFREQNGAEDGENGDYSPSQLWHNLATSNLLRIFWKDRDRRFLGASKAFLDYYGFDSADEIIGKNDEDLGWHVQPDRYKKDELKVINNGVTLHYIPGLCMIGGENKEILASKTPLYNANGEIKGLMGYFIDRGLLAANDKRGMETSRRDMLTGLLNSRGISEEATTFRDAYLLRGTDFVRIHISINDFKTMNNQYGYDFGDKILNAFGKALKREFGRTCVVGRYAGGKFVVLHQVQSRAEASELRAKIKAVGETIRAIEGVPVTLYLSVGYVLFSEFQDLDEQTRTTETRLHADYDRHISAESRIAHASEIFSLFDDLPISYSVYHVTYAENSGLYDAVIFYVNHKYEEYGGAPAKNVLGHSVRELYPYVGNEWFRFVRRAALDGENVEGVHVDTTTGKRYHFTARQIIYPGYCAVTYQELPT